MICRLESDYLRDANWFDNPEQFVGSWIDVLATDVISISRGLSYLDYRIPFGNVAHIFRIPSCELRTESQESGSVGVNPQNAEAEFLV